MATLDEKFDAKRNEMFSIFPEHLTLVTDKAHPLYDPRVEDGFNEKHVLAAMANGMNIPILIKKEGDKLLVVDGRQRTKNTVEANKRLKKQGAEPLRVRVVCERGTEGDMIGLMISGNELSTEDTIANKAYKLGRYMATGKTKKEAALVFGVSEQSISNWQDYLELPAAVRKAVDSGVLTASAAAAMKDLSADEQKAKLDELKASGVKATVGAVRNVVAGKSAASKPKPSGKVIEKIAALPEVPGEFLAFIKFIRGDATREETEEILPWLKAPEEPAEEEPAGKVRVTGKKRGKKQSA